MPFLSPNQQRQSTEEKIPTAIPDVVNTTSLPQFSKKHLTTTGFI